MAPCYAIPTDESCDIVDFEKMSIFVRFLDVKSRVFKDEFPELFRLKSKTCEKDLFKTFNDLMTKSNISYDKIVSIPSDGAPEMIGKAMVFFDKIKDKKAKIHSYQCIIRQKSVCGKIGTALKGVIDIMIKLIKIMRSQSSLYHRQFMSIYLNVIQCIRIYLNIIMSVG